MQALIEAAAKAKPIPTGLVNGNIGVYSGFTSSESEDEPDTNFYEQEFVAREMTRYANTQELGTSEDDLGDGLSEVDGEEYSRAFRPEMYTEYNFETTFAKPKLPIDSFRTKIIHMIGINPVIIIQGDTGCGKSTQVPQYILDECRENNEWCNIVVTQPRKIAAITVSRRVCEERGWSLGTVCGYQIGLEKKTTHNSLITYMTTGVLLQKIIQAKSLNPFSHILVDEVHERNQELDFLLLVIRKYLFTNSPNTKVILMSATIQAKDFAHYFRSQNMEGELMAPIITIDKKNIFTKQIVYIDQLSIFTTLPFYDKAKPEIAADKWQMFMFILKAFDKIEKTDPVTKEQTIGNVLVFLPGLNEIEEANKRLTKKGERGADDVKWEIIPLHSSLPNDEQVKVFRPPKPGHRKIILSTNIAESSITVPDINYVIDFCMTKVLVIDPITKYSSLQLEWASQVNCDQRAGRVGRVSSGRVYRLVPEAFYDNSMDARGLPEILRAPLESVVLHAKMLNLQDTPRQILALAMNPPNLKNIEATIWSLKEVGGLLQTCRGIKSNADGDITFLGEVMAGLPLDVRLSKLILLGHMFNCLEEAIIIAAGCSIQNIFSVPFQQRFLAYKKLLFWSDGSSSDPITLLNLYNVWQTYIRENHFENMHQKQHWCKQNFVSLKGMKEWNLLIDEIKQRLSYFNIINRGTQGRTALGPTEKPTVLKVILCGAFYPNYFTRSATCGQIDEREAVRSVGGRDPFRTVFLSGFDGHQPGILYTKQIKAMFIEEAHNEQNINVGFDGSCKIYIEFKRKLAQNSLSTINVNGTTQVANIPGKIPSQVYECVRKRQLKYTYTLNLLSPADAWKWADESGLMNDFRVPKSAVSEEKDCFSPIMYDPIPSLDIEFIKVHITTTIDAGHFWCQHVDDETNQLSYIIERELNRQVLHPACATPDEATKLQFSKIYAARWSADDRFYRCRINACDGKCAYVIFIDYGNLQKVPVHQIYNLPNQRELLSGPLAMECVLSGIKPSLEKSPQAVFTKEANTFFTRLTDSRMLLAKVYSVVDDVLHLELFYKDQNKKQHCMNKVLVEKGFALEMKEGFLSEENHLKRVSVQSGEEPIQTNSLSLLRNGEMNTSNYNAPDNYDKEITLKGPFSPLEMRLYGNMLSSGQKQVRIEQNSVNTVLLDSEPQDPNTRLVVAGSVHQNQSGSSLNLRQTTLMPNIPGLTAMVSLLFCPSMEPKLLDDGTRVASILCGMGYHEVTEKPLFPSHDMSIILDTKLTAEEIDEVNNIRFLMNTCVKSLASNYAIESDLDNEEILDCQKKIKEGLFRLLYRKRTTVDPINVRYSSEWQKSESDATILQPGIPEEADDIWPLLWFVKLHDVTEDVSEISKNIEDIKLMAKGLIPFQKITCQLCDLVICDFFDCCSHLVNSTHRENCKMHQERILFSDDE